MAKPQPEPWKGRIARKRDEEKKHDELLVKPEVKPEVKPQTKGQARPESKPTWKKTDG